MCCVKYQAMMVLALLFHMLTAKADLLGIAPYPNAKIEEKQQRDVTNHQVVLSAVRKVNGLLRAEKELWLDGTLHRVLYQIPTGHSNKEAFDYFVEQVSKSGSTVLFRCEERRCGSSNLWANQVFEVAKLYGPDREQYYQVAKYFEQQQLYYIALYTIRRGNRRVYAMVEIFKPKQKAAKPLLINADALLAQLNEQGFADVFGIPDDAKQIATNDSYQVLRQLVKEHSLRLVIVGQGTWQVNSKVSLASSLEMGKAYAQQIQQQLVLDGVAAEDALVMTSGPALSIKHQTLPAIRIIKQQ
ncbi:DUF4892 domain-containing protein [Zooshikella ganghwensis]|uniref:DUF4892 domain-containing protein n=1 Tax=Zooshikella ganghwensis TaxID=202772 RepID=A0A4P9VPM9_9GAMM|nr:DUF4892 domain-containing protein [Zooshikella ganghwensis]RDH44467.1 DUF4892 domain-containing protein [Zooshikella ganghwensis]